MAANHVAADVSPSRARLVTSRVLLAGGTVFIIASLVNGFTSDPQEGEGWIGGVIEAVFAGGPLLAVGFGLRSPSHSVLRLTAFASLALALLVGFVLVMQLLDANETARDRLLSALGAVLYLAAFAVGLPSLTGRRTTHGTPAHS